jgi:hypothetical protein
VTGIVINLHSIKGNTTLYLCYSWGGFLAGFSWGGFLANEFSRNWKSSFWKPKKNLLHLELLQFLKVGLLINQWIQTESKSSFLLEILS